MVRKFTPLEDAFLTENPDMKDVQIGAVLGRSRQSIANRRWYLKKSGYEIDAVSYRNKSPFRPGNRIILAKTCSKCGKFIDACRFRVINKALDPACRFCNARRPRTKQERFDSHANTRRLQAISVEKATKIKKEWSKEEDNAVRSAASSGEHCFLTAIKLGRTYGAVITRRQVLGVASSGLGDPVDFQWMIKFAEAS